jgi:HEAT repeat protein
MGKSKHQVSKGLIFGVLGLAGVAFAGATVVNSGSVKAQAPDALSAALAKSPVLAQAAQGVASAKGDVAPQGALQYQFKVGQGTSLRFTRSFSGHQGGKPVPVHELNGTLQVLPIRVEKGVATLIGRFDFRGSKSELISKEAQIEMGMGEKPSSSESALLLFDVSSKGRVQNIRALPKGPSNEALVSMVDILHSAVFRLPDTLNSDRPEVSEDSEGNLRKMQFKVELAQDRAVILGSGILDASGQGSSEGTPINPAEVFSDIERKSDERVEWGVREGLPLRHDQNAHVSIQFEGKNAAQVDLKSSSDWTQSVDLSDLKKFDLKAFTRFVKVKEIQAQARDEQNAAEAEKGFELIRKNLEKIPQEQKVSEGANAVFQGMAMALLKNPKMLPFYLKEAKGLPKDSMARDFYLGAIAGLATPEAQKALIEFYQDSSDSEKERVLIKFSSLGAPHSSDSKLFLGGLFRERGKSELGKMAGFALGHALYLEKDAALEKELKALAGGSKSVEEQVYALQIIGNAKAETFLAEIKQGLSNESEEVRITAADALRNSKDPSIRKIIYEVIKKDKSPGVREFAYNSIKYGSFDSKDFDLVRKCVQEEPAANVKSVCYDILLIRKNLPEVLELLKQRLEKESDDGIKERIGSALGKE